LIDTEYSALQSMELFSDYRAAEEHIWYSRLMSSLIETAPAPVPASSAILAISLSYISGFLLPPWDAAIMPVMVD
jgi:hypothetical protein